MTLYCDNKAAISIAHNPVQHDQVKDIEIDRHFIKEKLNKGMICMPFVKSEDQLADVFTKGLSKNASCGRATYVHCKAGRGRSTTIVLCYLLQHKQMMPDAAYSYVKSIWPRVLLASSQWQAVQEFYHHKVKMAYYPSDMANLILTTPKFLAARDLKPFDDSSVVLITKTDLDGYDPSHEFSAVGSKIWTDLSLVCRIQVTGQAALAKLSCLWLCCHTQQKVSSESSCRITADQLRVLSVDIHVFEVLMICI
ncbi:hypothetical protein HYC85_026705 [Camellia sinensis]|uniref:Tyrosine specific protein phosphatases domain-containing protein n=1 Tax=Camellia sinensis TaxID=4442 RepID=A0A7J7G8C3_CAMSI|nr:hypothetical protein HYC85_026705 [Camellia sinensis]